MTDTVLGDIITDDEAAAGFPSRAETIAGQARRLRDRVRVCEADGDYLAAQNWAVHAEAGEELAEYYRKLGTPKQPAAPYWRFQNDGGRALRAMESEIHRIVETMIADLIVGDRTIDDPFCVMLEDVYNPEGRHVERVDGDTDEASYTWRVGDTFIYIVFDSGRGLDVSIRWQRPAAAPITGPAYRTVKARTRAGRRIVYCADTDQHLADIAGQAVGGIRDAWVAYMTSPRDDTQPGDNENH